MQNKYQQAIGAKESRDFEQAILLFRECIKEKPLDVEMYVHLAHTLSLSGDDKRAWFLLEKAEKIDSQNALLLAHKARLLLKFKKIKEAFYYIQIAVSKEKSPFIYLTLANILKAKKDIKQAEFAINLSIQTDLNYAEAYAFRALLFYQKGQIEKALMDIKKAVELKPHLDGALNMLSIVQHKLNNITEAIDALNRLLQYTPREKQDKIFIKMGELSSIKGDVDSAINFFKLSLEINHNNGKIYKKIANLLVKKSMDSNEAIKYYHKAIEFEPNDFESFNNLAVMQGAQNKLSLAIENYKKALIINPNIIDTYVNISLLFIEQKDFDKAIDILNKGLSINPQYFDIYLQLGSCFKEMNQLDKSLEFYKKAMKIEEKNPLIYHHMAIVYMYQGKLDNAIQNYHTSLEYNVKRIYEAKSFDIWQRKSIDTTNAIIALKKLHRAFEKKKIPFFLVYGTLLGVIREGGILPHDKDMDIGLDWDLSRELVMEIFIDAGFEIKSTSKTRKKWIITGIYKELNISIDAFFYKNIDDKMISGFEGKPYPIMWEFPKFELVEYEWSGYKWLIPDPYEVYFESVYGKNWRVPDKAFDTVLSAYNLASESRELSICFGLSRLIGVIKDNNYQKAIGYCQQLLRVHDYPIIHEVMKSMEYSLKELAKYQNTIKGYPLKV